LRWLDPTARWEFLRCKSTRRNYAAEFHHHNIEMKVFMLNNKTNFIATLSDQFRISSNWREAKATRFSHDARNAEAAKRLFELESQIVIPEDAWKQLEPLVSGLPVSRRFPKRTAMLDSESILSTLPLGWRTFIRI
jgi:hypothetical protein